MVTVVVGTGVDVVVLDSSGTVGVVSGAPVVKIIYHRLYVLKSNISILL